jgi:DNA-damage-inducible protein D
MTEMTLFGQSPFDAIRRTDERGECWSARELMPLLEYAKWQNFESVIRSASVAIEQAGGNAGQHVYRQRETVNGFGAEKIDYRLTRYGAYMVTLECDGRKQAVSEAKSYFAVRAREAEVAGESGRRLPQNFAEALRALADEVEAREIAEQRAAELEPAATSWERLAEAEGDYSLRDAAQILDRDPAISTGQNRLAKTLRELLWTDRNGTPYQRHVDLGRLAVRSRTYAHPSTGEDQLTRQVRITARGLHDLHRLMGGTDPMAGVALAVVRN